MSLNKITLSGNLGADAELRYTKSGNPVVSFSLAVNERTPNGDGTWGEYTNWPDCVMFGKRAEALAPWLRKGTKISLIGRKMRAKKVAEGIDMPTYAHDGDAGLDLRITETVTLEPMQKCVVGCGLAVEIPSGCVGLVFPRSGLAAKQGITLSNSVGVIDSGYRGEVCAALINQSYETVTLEAGTRVCQLVVMPYVPCELVPVDELSDTERGAGGFGSTGVE